MRKAAIHLRIAALVGAAAMLRPAAAVAFPEGAPWDMPVKEGCAACHFDGPVRTESDALSLAGLPDRFAPGQSLDLTVELSDRTMQKAGFMIFFEQMSGPAGEAASESTAVEALGARARSTDPEVAPAAVQWHLRWTAPQSLKGPVRVTIWGNAANADDSPFGDRIHRRIYLVQPARP